MIILSIIRTLLIVPYGIETSSPSGRHQRCKTLLIVPYGIETFLHPQVADAGQLLIVPYGIETKLLGISFYYFVALLIVPYGIETLSVTIIIDYSNVF